MIQSISLSLRYQGRVSGRKRLVFKPGLNVIIGPNGSGKSSLLAAIHNGEDCQRQDGPQTRYIYFNSETMNPHRSQKSFTGVYGSIVKVRAMFSSHGETMRDVLRSFRFGPGDCFLLDEPESGHDLEWAIKIRNGLEDIARQGCQVILASHHPVFWKKANIIELKRGYLKRALRRYRSQLTQL